MNSEPLGPRVLRLARGLAVTAGRRPSSAPRGAATMCSTLRRILTLGVSGPFYLQSWTKTLKPSGVITPLKPHSTGQSSTVTGRV